MSGFDRMDLRAAPASTSGPVVSAFRHGGTPSISISIVKLSTVLMSTIMPRTAASVSEGVDVTVLTMSAATSSSRPRRIAPPSDSRKVLNARPPLPVRFQVTMDSANANRNPTTIDETPRTSNAWVARSKNSSVRTLPRLWARPFQWSIRPATL